MRIAVLVLALFCSMLTTTEARAFCGFYVAGADAKLFNNATLVVMMRDGTHTVLSMQNNYQGPPESFAMVVPVPVVLQKENVKTLDPAIFARVDKLAAPRLVEYWETDPCYVMPPTLPSSRAMADPPTDGATGGGVKVEAEFKVGEYDVVVLSSDDSTALETWLRDNKYSIPKDAEPLLQPYVASGMKFFVAKVDATKVKMKDGMAMLSPLRFDYEDKAFRLPVRLGLVNSKGTQDLLVHIVAKSRYDVANYENVTIPTNIDVDESAKKKFGAFYAALFDRTLEKHPKAVVTEYAWDTASCDPCPAPPLNMAELSTLGADVLEGITEHGNVLTRLHVRYSKDSLGEDLVFRKAEPIAGGREFRSDGKLEKGAQKAGQNNFQARYAIRHPWKGRIACPKPQRGRWGGPPGSQGVVGDPTPALDLAFAPRGGIELASFIKSDVSELDIKAKRPVRQSEPPVPVGAKTPPPGADSACGCTVPGQTPSTPVGAWMLGLALLALRKRAA
jgi:MYXO-CTERM domain-containing protein